ncbi:MAG: hypothetical protein CMF49_09475 [Legionellales bacterium]|nr:hypothetical protein [Legionellales bacterium]|tara:strand:+ start:200 stop:610 length:411 start_codon:yes stop_codon:yes gene_type:complete
MKKLLSVFCLFTVGLFFISNSYAFDIALLFSNHTNITVKTEGTVNLENSAGMSWAEPTKPTMVWVSPKTDNVPQDQPHKNLVSYDLNYFDVINEQGKLKAVCMSNYLGLSKTAVIKFDLFQDQNNRFYCKRTITYA